MISPPKNECAVNHKLKNNQSNPETADSQGRKFVKRSLNKISPDLKKYNCESCSFHTDSKKDFIRHENTIKHKRKLFKYCCKKCKFYTNDEINFNHHKKRTQHKKKHNFFCKKCKKEYKSREGLWTHKRDKHNKEEKDEQKKTNADMLIDIIETNKKLVKTLKNQGQTQKEIMSQLKNVKQPVQNNTQININLFLNDKCKNAMNITDFVNKIKVTFEDLVYAKDNGSVLSIGDVFMKHLTDLEPTERPIHCSDKKRLKFYIKDDNKWEKDDKNMKLDHTIGRIQSKQMDKLQEWTKGHPNWMSNEKESDIYIEMVRQIAWERNEIKRNKKKIKQNIGKHLEIKEVIANNK